MFPSLLRQGEMFEENLIVQTLYMVFYFLVSAWFVWLLTRMGWIFFVLLLAGYLFRSCLVYFSARAPSEPSAATSPDLSTAATSIYIFVRFLHQLIAKLDSSSSLFFSRFLFLIRL